MQQPKVDKVSRVPKPVAQQVLSLYCSGNPKRSIKLPCCGFNYLSLLADCMCLSDTYGPVACRPCLLFVLDFKNFTFYCVLICKLMCAHVIHTFVCLCVHVCMCVRAHTCVSQPLLFVRRNFPSFETGSHWSGTLLSELGLLT